ncbi:MAG: hypothetical protein WCP52_13610 [Bacteroidota bacterium]
MKKVSKKQLLSTLISETKLGWRAKRAFANIGINTIGELIQLSKVDIIRMDIGSATYFQIINFVDEVGLEFKPYNPKKNKLR